jgi:hypothetical protein
MNAVRHLLPRLLLVILGCGLIARHAFAADDDTRFSATLTTEQRTDSGLTQLSLDNVAVIDGLVRQDIATSKFKNNNVDGTRFSQRRTPRERSLAGLDQLNAAQLARLDRLVRRRIVGPDADSESDATLIAPARPAPVIAVKPSITPHSLELHGEISYTMGWSKGGGNFQGSDIVVTYDDPKDRFSVLVGYSEYHGKGLPWCFYPGGGPYRPLDEDFINPMQK